ncbi:MAG TPA: methyltransferase domain-containing protein [Capillimicrobium sp.]|nr:methyltransferase domain-containing protein [Capillimicrobium sp.]
MEDPEVYRQRTREAWERAAEGWAAHAERWEPATRPVSQWMADALEPRPGARLLELASGPGDVGLLLAERVKPGGTVVITDGAEPMVEAAKARAEARGLADVVEARAMEAEWIDLPAASVDGVACRWGYMLLADPGAALRETRRVLRPGGRVALAAWDGPEANPWSALIGRALVEGGLAEAPDPAAPGQFAWRERAAIGERLEDAGFVDVTLDTVSFTLAFPSLDDWWDAQIDVSPTLRVALAAADPAQRDEVMEAAQAAAAEYVRDGGEVVFPAASHVASAEA